MYNEIKAQKDKATLSCTGKQAAKLRLTKSGSKAQPLDGIPYPSLEGISLPEEGRRSWGSGECARLGGLPVQDKDARREQRKGRGSSWDMGSEVEREPGNADKGPSRPKKFRLFTCLFPSKEWVGDLRKLRSI